MFSIAAIALDNISYWDGRASALAYIHSSTTMYKYKSITPRLFSMRFFCLLPSQPPHERPSSCLTLPFNVLTTTDLSVPWIGRLVRWIESTDQVPVLVWVGAELDVEVYRIIFAVLIDKPVASCLARIDPIVCRRM